LVTRDALQPTDFAEFGAVGDPQLSPDGQWAVFVLRRTKLATDKTHSELWIVSTSDGKPRRLTAGPNDSSPRWSPDGRYIAFTSKRDEKSRIYVLPFAEGGEAWTINTDHDPSGAPDWSPGGDRLLYSAKVFSKPDDWEPYPGAPRGDRKRASRQADENAGDKDQENNNADSDNDGKQGNVDIVELVERSDVKVIYDMYYRLDGVGLLGDVKTHLFTVDFLTPGAPEFDDPPETQLTSGDFNHSNPAWSPDGRYVAYTAFREERRWRNRARENLYVVDVTTGSESKLLEAEGPFSGLSWSPDSRYVVYSGHHSKFDETTTSGLWLVDIRQALASEQPLGPSQTRELTAELERPVGRGQYSDVGYRGGPSKAAFWAEDGRSLVFSAATEGRAAVYRLDFAGTADLVEAPFDLSPVYQPEMGGFSSFVALPTGIAACTLVAPNSPGELAVIDLTENDPQPRLLTSVNRNMLETHRLGSTHRFRYKAHDGLDLDSWFIVPSDQANPAPFDLGEVSSNSLEALASLAGDSGPYPLILFVHGGPHGWYGDAFQFQQQLFASNGYAVLYTNPRGSQSYGSEFAMGVIEDWGGGDYRDIMGAVDLLVEAGVADPARLGVTGWSYGGFMTNWIITHTTRFRAAVAGASLADMFSDYGNTDMGIGFDDHNFGGVPWEEPKKFLEHSPLMFVEHVETPVLLLHGENDMRCHITQADEFYTALKRLDKEAYIVRYPGEFHGLKKPKHIADRYIRMLAWFNYHLKS